MNTKTFVAVLTLMVALIGGAYYFTSGHGLLTGEPLKLAEAKAETDYKAAGLPWTNTDLKGTAVPTGTKAMKILNAFPTIHLISAKAEDAITLDLLAGDYAKAMGALAPVDSQLDRAARLVKTKDLYFGYNFDAGSALLLPEYSNMKSYVKYLCMRGTAKAGSGDMAGCLEDYKSAIAIRCLPEKCPLVIGLLVELGENHLIQRSLAGAAAALKNSPEKVNVLFELAPQLDSHMSLKEAYAADAYMELASSRNWDTFQNHGNIVMPSGWPSDVKSANYELRTARYWSAVFDGVGKKWDDLDAVSNAMHSAINQYPPLKHQGKDYDEFFGSGSFEVNHAAVDRSHDNLINLYFAAIRYQIEHGKAPANLAAISNKDQMTEAKRYSLKGQPGGFVVSGQTPGDSEYSHKINMTFPPVKGDRW